MNLPRIHTGPCCACGQSGPTVKNWILLPVLALQPGRGWGCKACDLPRDGAIAVICNGCFGQGKPVYFACASFPGDPARVPVVELMGEFEHNLANHPNLGFQEERGGE